MHHPILDPLRLLVRRHPVLEWGLSPVSRLRREVAISSRSRFLRSLREALTEDPALHVGNIPGTFVIDRQSDTFARIVSRNEYEPELTRVCAKLVDPTRDVVDIGANVGLYTVHLANQLTEGRVLAIEPTPNALRRLHQNILANGVAERVVVFEGVVADSTARTWLNTIAGKEEYSSLGSIVHPSAARESSSRISVQSEQLDALVAKHQLDPGFIKVDVEGAEHRVFRGCERLLREYRPIIVSELSNPLLKRNGSSSREVIRFLREYRYSVVDALVPRLAAGKRSYGNILCIPEERTEEVHRTLSVLE